MGCFEWLPDSTLVKGLVTNLLVWYLLNRRLTKRIPFSFSEVTDFEAQFGVFGWTQNWTQRSLIFMPLTQRKKTYKHNGTVNKHRLVIPDLPHQEVLTNSKATNSSNVCHESDPRYKESVFWHNLEESLSIQFDFKELLLSINGSHTTERNKSQM